MRKNLHLLALVLMLPVFTKGNEVIKKRIVLPQSIHEAISRAASIPEISINKRNPIQEAAGDVLKKIGSKLVQGATSVLTAGANHVSEASKIAEKHQATAKKEMDKLAQKAGNYKAVKLSLMPQKGELGFGNGISIQPPGYTIATKFTKEDKQKDKESNSNPYVAYPFGVGVAMMNGCYGRGYQKGDPCYVQAKFMDSKLCLNMLDAAAFIGAGFDGRGDYSSEYRKKSLVQRMCASRGSFADQQVPDTMNVHGVYDTEVEQTVFSSSGQYQRYLESKAAVSSYKYSFSEAIRKSFGVSASFNSGGVSMLFGGAGPSLGVSTSGSTAHSQARSSSIQASSYASGRMSKMRQQTFMSLLEVNVIRFEIFMDEVKPTDLSQAFLEDFLSLPINYFSANTPIKYQNFILRWGTHYVKSAKFGGHLRLTRTKTFKGSADIAQFAQTANTDAQALFSNSASAHSSQFNARASANFWSGISASANYKQDNSFKSNTRGSSRKTASSSTQASKSKQTSNYGNEYMLVEGGSQEIASILSDFYSPSFKATFVSWLETIPSYPKPFKFQMNSITDLLNMNIRSMFNSRSNSAGGCAGTDNYDADRQQYYYKRTITRPDNTTTTIKRYCKFGRTAIEFQRNFDQRRRSLHRAIAVYMEEGAVPAYDLNIKAGDVGCEAKNLQSVRGKSTGNIPKWTDLINGNFFKMMWNMPYDIPRVALAKEKLMVTFNGGYWYNKRPHEKLNLFNRYKNGGTSVSSKKKVSINGLILTYDERFGTFTVSKEDYVESKKELVHLPHWLKGTSVAQAMYIHPFEHLQIRKQSGGFAMLPCNLKFSNSYKFDPTVQGGRCIKFTAATKGDIFVVFATIPRIKSTWYYVQITPSGVAFYKGKNIVRIDSGLESRGLGERALYQSYFICILDNINSVTINYGISNDNSAVGVIHMTWTDRSNPNHVKYYAFGGGSSEVNMMGIHLISSDDMGQLRCNEKMVNGQCVQDCHKECKGCTAKNSDTACLECTNYKFRTENGIQCVETCPSNTDSIAAEKKCQCKLAYINKPFTCLESCPNGTIPFGKVCKTDNKPIPLGCYKDKLTRDLPKSVYWADLTLTISKCIKECKRRRYSYAAVQGGKYCFCGNSYNKYGHSKLCNYKCAGDKNTFCGGDMANFVYSLERIQ